MKAILAIARAEILKNWKIIAVPLFAVIGVLVLAALGTKISDRDFRGSLMGIFILFGAPLAAVPAAVLGLNLFGPDIRQRKLSFFLTRPCAPSQLWLGRLFGAAFLVSFGWVAAVTLPHLVDANGFTSGSGMSMSAEAFLAAAGLAGVFLALNSISMVLAANSPRWFVADAVAAMVLFAGAAWSLEHALRLGDLPGFATAELYGIALAALIALLFAGMAFLQVGHGDGPSGHRAHSVTLWVFGALTLAGLGAHHAYEWSRPVGGLLRHVSATPLYSGKAVIQTWGGQGGRSFLLDIHTGEASRASGTVRLAKSGLLGHFEERIDPIRIWPLADYLVVSSLERGPRPVVDQLVPDRFVRLMDISPDGGLAIFRTLKGLAVMRTRDGATEFEHQASNLRFANFEKGDRIVAFDSDGAQARLSIMGLDGKLIEERRFPISGPGWLATVHGDSGRVAVLQQGRRTLYERDGRAIATVSNDRSEGSRKPGASTGWSNPRFTRAGDFLVFGGGGLRAVRHGEALTQDVPLLSDGKPISLDGVLWLCGELESGEVMLHQRQVTQGTDSVFLVDHTSGTVNLRLDGLHPLYLGPFHGIVSLDSASEDSALRLFRNEDGDIVFLDPGSRTPRLLVKNLSEDR